MPQKRCRSALAWALLTRINGIIERAEKQGAKLRVDGRSPRAPEGYSGGNWLGATVIDQVKADSECATTEIFGPVLTIVRVKTIAEAMELESKNPYGNATSVFTTSGSVARSVAERASSGMIGVNIGVPVPREPFSFGGTKSSKFGACDITGESALEFWTTLKKVTTKWTAQSDHNWMS
jgi:malonate-semialdehyde dehydrogenase (acetylating) / methylmalonate-semialdehyde dehydrogenase